MKPHAHIAVDFGGGSGRVMAGRFDGTELILDEVYRFANKRVRLGGHDYWDFPRLFAEMIEGLRKASGSYSIDSIAVDTWGVDFGLVDEGGMLMGLPVSYRDGSVAGAAERFFAKGITPEEFYSRAGIQIMDIDTVFRLADFKREHGPMLQAAAHLLFTPDLFNYFLTGRACCEVTIASTSGLINPRTRRWDDALIARCGLPFHIFPTIVEPGSVVGRLTEDVALAIGVDYPVSVVAVGSHDTASAVAVVGGRIATDGTAFLSSGTWSLLGATLDSPITDEAARQGGFTNECGVDGKICFLQNITGLWILQRLVEEWGARGLETDYGRLVESAEQSRWEGVIDVDSPAFHNPVSMSEAIARSFADNGEDAPVSQADMTRCVLQSLALRYREGVAELEKITGNKIKRLQIIGGGSRNRLLNRLTAEATGLEVVGGPVEATAIGNLLVQARTMGTIESFSNISKIT